MSLSLMPGIAGIISRQLSADAPSVVDRMTRELYVEMRDASKPCLIQRPSVVAGWAGRRASFSDVMPARNEDQSITLLFSGEEFSIGSELSRLRTKGHRVDGNDATALVHLYEDDPGGFYRRLNGWFSGVLVDDRAGTITLFNDRFGMGRIYWHESNGALYFASEAKALLAIKPALRAWDERGLAETLTLGCALQNKSLFKSVQLLPPGSAWTFYLDGRWERRTYFCAEEWEQQTPLDEEAYIETLADVVGRVIPRYVRNDGSVGVSVTGGLDSRIVMAWCGAAAGSLPTYTFGGPYRECADVRIGRKVAKLCGQSHTTLPVAMDFFGQFAELAESTVRISDGTMDVSGAVELYVNRKAREIAPIRLTGNYGSEILRSHVAFRPRQLDSRLFTPEFVQLATDAAETYHSEFNSHRLTFIAAKQVPWHHHARHTLERSQLLPRSPFLDNDLVALAYRTPKHLAQSPEPILKLIARGNPALGGLASDRALRQGFGSWRDHLRHQWQEFTAKAEYAYDYGMPQKLVTADRFLRPLRLERFFLGRHKFYHFRSWYRHKLAEYVQDSGSRGEANLSCYRSGIGRRLSAEHTAGLANWTSELHRLLTLQLVERTLLKGS